MKKGKTPPPNDNTVILDADTRRAQRRVAKVRDKLTKAMQDPDTRAQMVAAIRQMMLDAKK